MKTFFRYGCFVYLVQLSWTLSCYRCMDGLKSTCNFVNAYTPVVPCFDDDEVCYMECARNRTVVKRDCTKDNSTSELRR